MAGTRQSGLPEFRVANLMEDSALLALAQREHLQPVDTIAVVRHNKKLKLGNWHKAAEEENFFLRGFNYLLIFKKTGAAPEDSARGARI